MSLSLAIAQIQRPTWWYDNERDQSKKKPASAETIAKRAEILEWLRAQGKKIEGAAIQRQFGLTNSQMWHLLDPLVENGQVIKYKPRHDKSLLEAAANAGGNATERSEGRVDHNVGRQWRRNGHS